jgi:hypothetical protein
MPTARPVLSLLLPGLCLLALRPTEALASTIYTITFSQSTVSGGTLSGAFTGKDLDHDGWLNSFTGEISAYSLSYSGNLIVGAFSHSIADFSTAVTTGGTVIGGLVYRLGGSFLGDDTTFPYEGIASGPISGFSLPPPGFSTVGYRIGYGPTGVLPQPFGFIDNTLGGMDFTVGYVLITSVVPEPPALVLVAFGLFAALARYARSRKRRPVRRATP